MSRRTLNNLPDELLLAVLDYIHDDLPTLCALNKTNWHFHHLTDDRLYGRFRGNGPEKFLRAIALQPPHGRPASHVRDVVWYQTYWSREPRRQRLSPPERQLLVDQLKSVMHDVDNTIANTIYHLCKRFMNFGIESKARSWYHLSKRFRNFEPDREIHWWYLEFFLLFTPNVERLEVYDAWQWDDHVYWFNTLADYGSHFERLKSITIHGPLRLANIIPLLGLPSIRELTLFQVVAMAIDHDRMEDFELTDPARAIEQRLAGGSSLEYLALRESHDHISHGYGPILGALKNLKSFTYEHLYNELARVRQGLHAQPTAETILRTLFRQESNIESLRIRKDWCLWGHNIDRYCLVGCSSSGSQSCEFPRACPRALRKLRTLDIGPCDFGGFYTPNFSVDLNEDPGSPLDHHIANHLPNTLETLRLEWYYDTEWEDRLPSFLHFLDSISRTIASTCPKLKEVAIVDWPALAGWFPLPNELANLISAYEEVGIRFSLMYENVQGTPPLEVLDGEEPGWLWVQKTDSFEQHSWYSRH